MAKRPRRTASAAPPESGAALFVELDAPSLRELERLQAGSGRLMRQITEAVERWRAELDVETAAGVIPVILLYRLKRPAPE